MNNMEGNMQKNEEYFNVADIFITIGCFLLIIISLKGEKDAKN